MYQNSYRLLKFTLLRCFRDLDEIVPADFKKIHHSNTRCSKAGQPERLLSQSITRQSCSLVRCRDTKGRFSNWCSHMAHGFVAQHMLRLSLRNWTLLAKACRRQALRQRRTFLLCHMPPLPTLKSHQWRDTRFRLREDTRHSTNFLTFSAVPRDSPSTNCIIKWHM